MERTATTDTLGASSQPACVSRGRYLSVSAGVVHAVASKLLLLHEGTFVRVMWVISAIVRTDLLETPVGWTTDDIS